MTRYSANSFSSSAIFVQFSDLNEKNIIKRAVQQPQSSNSTKHEHNSNCLTYEVFRDNIPVTYCGNCWHRSPNIIYKIMMLHTGNNTTTDKDDNTISRKQKVKTISTINTIWIMLKLTT